MPCGSYEKKKEVKNYCVFCDKKEEVKSYCVRCGKKEEFVKYGNGRTYKRFCKNYEMVFVGGIGFEWRHT